MSNEKIQEKPKREISEKELEAIFSKWAYYHDKHLELEIRMAEIEARLSVWYGIKICLNEWSPDFFISIGEPFSAELKE